MADESFQEKTEAPTPKRRQDAFKKGEVPRSQEVTTAFLLLAAAGALTMASTAAARSVVEIFRMAVSTLSALPAGVEGVTGFLRQLGYRTMTGLAPMILVMAGVALAVAAAQARGALTIEPLTPKWSRMDPIRRVPQIWGWKAVMELGKSLLKLAVVGVVVWMAVRSAAPEIMALGQQSPFGLLMLVQRYAVKLLLWAGLAYLIVAMLDYAFQIWQHEKQLKMTKEEIKKELKESEGDQVMKVRRRTMARQLARRRMLLAVSEADVVVTNPTHIAVALKYDPAVADAPMVLAMGERLVAQKIKEIAKEHGVPTVENKPLARALYATAKVGHPIPFELFVAVAEILAWVYKQAGYRPGARAARPWSGAEA